MILAACANCGKHAADVGQIHAEIQFKLDKQCCDNCQDPHTHRDWTTFCSIECLTQYATSKGFDEDIARLKQIAEAN